MKKYLSQHKYFRVFTIIFSMLSVFGVFVGNADAIGMKSNPIEISDVLRNQAVPEKLMIYNSSDKPEIYQLKSEGQISSWTSFYSNDDAKFENPITEITVPAKSNTPAKVIFRVPNDAQNGVYKGVIYIVYMPQGEGSEENTVAVGQRISRSVKLTVSDIQKIVIDAGLILAKRNYQPGEQVVVRAIFKNQGNVEIRPSIQLKITKDEKSIFNAIFPYPDNEEAVKPLQSKEFKEFTSWSTLGHEEGVYQMDMSVLIDGKVYKEEPFTFTIKKGDMSLSSSLIGSAKNNGDLPQVWIIAGMGILLAIIVAVITAWMRHRSKEI